MQSTDTVETKRTFPPRRRLGDEQEREVTRLYVETTTPVAQIGQQFGIGESSVYRIAQRNGASLRGRTPASTSASVPSVEAPDGVVSAPDSSVDPVAAEVATPVEPPVEVAAPPSVPVKARRTSAPRARRTTAPSTPAPAAQEIAAPTPASESELPEAAPPTPAPAPRRRGRRPAATQPAGRPAGRPPGRPAATKPAAPAPAPAASGARSRFRVRFEAERVIEAPDMRAALRQADSLGATAIHAITREA